MEQYIPKSALVAAIERRVNICKKVVWDLRTEENKDYYQGKAEAYSEMSELLNTSEVKEVDLEKEYKNFIKSDNGRSMFETAKHFFELGLKVSNPLTWKDIKEICVQSVLVEVDLGGLVSDERHYTEVLKRFKDFKERKEK